MAYDLYHEDVSSKMFEEATCGVCEEEEKEEDDEKDVVPTTCSHMKCRVCLWQQVPCARHIAKEIRVLLGAR